MQEKTWKRLWLPLCLARLVRKTSMERPVAKAAVDKEWKKPEKISGVGHDKSQKQIRGD